LPTADGVVLRTRRLLAHAPAPVVRLRRRINTATFWIRRQKTTVKIDRNHAELVTALVKCVKPRTVLELGFGAGEATKAIMAGLNYNEMQFSYTLVDNWQDFGGRRPAATNAEEFSHIDFVTSDEQAFVEGCKDQFDFIFSDADHFSAQNWFQKVYDDLLRPGGILLYHDVTNPELPNLREIYDRVLSHEYRHALFSENSRSDERCDRGLLVIFMESAGLRG
jgi:predicted O-methyltransferase YrrM